MMKLSIIIVHYKTYTLTKQTLEAVYASVLEVPIEVILVDNASQDGSVEQLVEDYQDFIQQGRLRILQNKENLGFSKANNRGIREATGTFILLLNSDTEVSPMCLAHSLDYLQRYNAGAPEAPIGALGCKVILQDGTLDHACKRGFPTPQASLYYFLGLHKYNPRKYGQYRASYRDEDEVGEVDCLTGAFMLMPRYVLEEVGLLDEAFFMYGEDIDLCYRIKAAGYAVMYDGTVTTVHYKGGSSKKRRTKVLYDFHHAMWLFYKKHYKAQYNKGVTLLVYSGIQVRYGLALLKNALLPKQ